MKIFKYNSKKIFFIAEAGGNHNGDILKAKKLIDVAKKKWCRCCEVPDICP